MDANDDIPARLLLVDDLPANLMALEAVLEPLGLELVTARSGSETLRHLLRDDPADFAAILLDVEMPGMDGIELARLIKQREKTRYVPLLFITAQGAEEEAVAHAYATGAVDYLRKPYNPAVLRSKVGVFVDLYRQRERLRRQEVALREAERREAQLLQTVREQDLLRREQALLRRERELMEAHARETEEMALRQRRFLRDVLFSLTEGRLLLCDGERDLPEPLPVLVKEPITLERPTLRALRRLVVAFAQEAGWPAERMQDFETAVGEAAMNAVVHGRDGIGRVHADPPGGRLQVWVCDAGGGIAEESLHRATLERGFSSAGTLGHGFYMMLGTCDRVSLLTGREGTTVVLEQGPEPLPPIWFQGFATEPTSKL